MDSSRLALSQMERESSRRLYSRVPTTLGRADLHLHTHASDGLMSARDLVDHVARETDLDVIAITDHDETCASLEAREWAARQGYRVQVVPGVEVTTRDGHLLALWVEERPPALRDLQVTAEWVLARGGLCIAPHPFTRLARTRFEGRTPADLRQAIENRTVLAEGRFATPGEMAADAIPQLARSMVHLPLRRIVRFARSRGQARASTR